MPMPERPLPSQVQAALRAGRAIEAIKLLREATGLGLKEAKDLVDQHTKQGGPGSPIHDPASALPPQVAQAMLAGNKIEAIRLMREQTGLGLKEAKDAVEASREANQVAPGEVPRRSNAARVVVAVLALVALYFFFRA